MEEKASTEAKEDVEAKEDSRVENSVVDEGQRETQGRWGVWKKRRTTGRM